MSIMHMSIQAGSLIVVVLLLRVLLWHRLPKLIFPLFWAVVLFRLLVPFSLPSSFSIENLWETANEKWKEQSVGLSVSETIFSERNKSSDTEGQTRIIREKKERNGFLSEADFGKKTFGNNFLWMIFWLIGAALTSIYFLVIYIHSRRRIGEILPIHSRWIAEWQRHHRLRRKLLIGVSARIDTPISYGIWLPRIVLPAGMEGSNTDRLHYVLTHEYCHIRRLDALWKLLAVAAVCLHWFNPLVWGMLYFLNQDLEVSCDEMVLRRLDGDHRAEYAYSLIAMAQKHNGFAPLYNHFSKNVVKERIVSIMKYKKTKLTVMVMGFLLVAVVSIFFVTSAKSKEITEKQREETQTTEEKSRSEISTSIGSESVGETFSESATDSDKYREEIGLFRPKETDVQTTENRMSEEERKNLPNYSEDEVRQLKDLILSNFEEMTIHEFQEKIWTKTDTAKYRDLLEKVSQDEYFNVAFYDRDLGEYLYYILLPLTSEKWQSRSFGNHLGLSTAETDGANLEWNIVMNVTDSYSAKIKQYYSVREEADKAMYDMFYERTAQELTSEQKMKPLLRKKVSDLEKQLSGQGIAVTIDFHFLPGNFREKAVVSQKQNKAEDRLFPKASKEDYQSLLKLKKDYESKTVATFNQELSSWAEENPERSERITTDIVWNTILAGLTKEEEDFVHISFFYSGQEIAAQNRARYKNATVEPVITLIELPERQDKEKTASYQLFYSFFYQIENTEEITVGERDRAIQELIAEVEKGWNEIPFTVLKSEAQQYRVDKILEEAIAKCSTDKIKLKLKSQRVIGEDESIYRR